MGSTGERIFGTCKQMCPSKEIVEREKQNRLHFFERLPATEGRRMPKADSSKCVKEYVRSAAGSCKTDPSQLRTSECLAATVDYLIGK